MNLSGLRRGSLQQGQFSPLPHRTRDLGGDVLSWRRCSEFGAVGRSKSDAGPKSAPERPHTGMNIPASTGAGLSAAVLVRRPGTRDRG